MSKAEKVIKCRNMMYVQQLRFFPKGKSFKEMYDHIEKNLNPKRLAGIVHDKDLKEDGKTLSEPQAHFMMQFENYRSLDQVAKIIGDESQYVQKWDNRPMNGFAYLIHATTNSRHLHQYSVDEVMANFDYANEIQRAMNRVQEKRISNKAEDKIDILLDKIAMGDIELKRAKDLLSGSEYAKHFKKLDAAHSLFLERSSESLHEEMAREKRIVLVYWIYGKTETGKTLLAEELARNMGRYYKTTTIKDPFQFYQAEPIVILDELRPDVIPYSEMLAMFDPFSGGKIKMSSRYYNKALSCHTIFVTTPYSPEAFYEKTVAYYDRRIDKPEQFYRRLSSILHMKMETIEKIEYDASFNIFLITDEKTNRYSKGNHQIITVPHLFDEIK